MSRSGNSFGGKVNLGRGLGEKAKADRFDQGTIVRSGIYPRKGKGLGQIGEAQYPDLFRKWNADSDWSRWRRGMEIAFNDLVGDSEQFMPVRVLRVPAFKADEGLKPSLGLLAGFPSRHSPEGRWTCAIKPRGSEVAPVAITADCQQDLLFINRFGDELPLITVTLAGLFAGGRPESADPLIGELVEDTAIDGETVIDEDDEAVILMCVAVYEDEGLMAFDASRYWKRERLANGRKVLREVQRRPDEPMPRFRVGRHLTQSTVISCNCPAHLGLEYGKLLTGPQLGSQALYPQRMPGAALLERPLASATDRSFRAAAEVRLLDPLEGVARRFALLSWERPPAPCCKHVHAVRFALGCPMVEPSDMPVVIDNPWTMRDGFEPWEGLAAPLRSPQFNRALERRTFFDEAARGLASTITTGAIGDAWGVTVEKTGLAPVQVGDPTRRAAIGDPRFCQQWMTEYPQQVEQAVLGDVYAGRLTQRWSFPYCGPGELVDEPFFLPATAVPQLLP